MALLGKLRQLLDGSAGAARGRVDKSLDSKFAITGTLLLVSIVIVAILVFLNRKFTIESKTYAALALEQQVISQQIAVNTLAAISGDLKVIDQLESSQRRYNEIILTLDNGDSQADLPALSSEFSSEYSALKSIWKNHNKNVSKIVAAKSLLENINEHEKEIIESLPRLISLSDGVVNDLVNSRAPGKNIALAASQLSLIHKMENSLSQILDLRKNAIDVSDNFSIDAEQIDTQLLAMLKGSKWIGIEKFKGKAVVAKLLELADLYPVVKKNTDEILKTRSQLFKVHEAASQIRLQNAALLKASENLVEKIRTGDNRIEVATIIAIGFNVLILILMVGLSYLLIRGSRNRLIESQDQNDKNQRAILRLLDEMTNLADGDLSTHTTVTEDITGAIADSVNYSIDALRDLVGTINKTAVQVGRAVRSTQNTTGQLEEASIAQAGEISSAGAAITRISESMSSISTKASDSAEVARKSVGIAHNGGETVRQTIAGMETIREQIQETSKRIKRLGESSQEIGDIVNLITEISDQTNILALNAAIQASMAGEAGRGFAVVADEVQRLAERTGDATKQIEALVKTIQADTNEASMSMEQSTANVVKGARLTENAGSALDRIEQVSMNLAQRILEISDSTKLQASESAQINKSMGVIQQITLKTSEGSGQASNSIGELSSMVDAMRKSVAGFKLPDMEAPGKSTQGRDQTGKSG